MGQRKEAGQENMMGTTGEGWIARYHDFTLSVLLKSDLTWDISAARPKLKITLETTEFNEESAKKSAACLAYGYLRDIENDQRPFKANVDWSKYGT